MKVYEVWSKSQATCFVLANNPIEALKIANQKFKSEGMTKANIDDVYTCTNEDEPEPRSIAYIQISH